MQTIFEFLLGLDMKCPSNFEFFSGFVCFWYIALYLIFVTIYLIFCYLKQRNTSAKKIRIQPLKEFSQFSNHNIWKIRCFISIQSLALNHGGPVGLLICHIDVWEEARTGGEMATCGILRAKKRIWQTSFQNWGHKMEVRYCEMSPCIDIAKINWIVPALENKIFLYY